MKMPILIVIFILLGTFIYAEDSFDCTGYEDDSYHPVYDADDCRHYWHCIYVNTVYMHAVKRVCPAGTEFDNTLRQCETATEVDCVPVRSPHMPKTTDAWRLKYSKLFSRIHWTTTAPTFVSPRKHPIFNLEDFLNIETTTMTVPEVETTEQIQVLPITWSETSTTFSLEELSKNLHALMLTHHASKPKHSGARFFQPGEPENEAEVYTSTTRRRTQRTKSTTSLPSTNLSSTIETTSTTINTSIPITFTTTVMMMVTTTTTTPAITTTTTMSFPMTSTDISSLTSSENATQFNRTINFQAHSRKDTIKGRHRRKNMTLYILTSDEHKIRRFSMNHTRGILINCNQLRRRLLGRRRRLRDITPTTSIIHTLIDKNSSQAMFSFHIYLLTIFSLYVL